MRLSKRRKWAYTLGLALVAALVDVGQQMVSGHIVNYDSAVVLGLIIGASGRALGAYIAARTLDAGE